jgi:hypothetical protein
MMSKFKSGPGSTRDGTTPAGGQPQQRPPEPPLTPDPEPATIADSILDWVSDHWLGIMAALILIAVIAIFWDDLGTAWRESEFVR